MSETVVNVKAKRVKCRNRLFETQGSFQSRQFRPRVRGIGCVRGTNRGKSEGVCAVLGTALDTVFWWKGKAGNESFMIYLVAPLLTTFPGEYTSPFIHVDDSGSSGTVYVYLQQHIRDSLLDGRALLLASWQPRIWQLA